MDAKERRYDVCLSFAGEQRGAYVEQVAAAMADSQVRVFYDRFAAEEMWAAWISPSTLGTYTIRRRATV